MTVAQVKFITLYIYNRPSRVQETAEQHRRYFTVDVNVQWLLIVMYLMTHRMHLLMFILKHVH